MTCCCCGEHYTGYWFDCGALNVCCRVIMPDKDEEMPGELLKVFPANNLQMMFLSGAKGTQVSLLVK